MTSIETDAEAAAVYENLQPGTGVDFKQAVRRGRRALAKMTAAERSAAVRDGLLRQHEPPERLEPDTMVTPDGWRVDMQTVVPDPAAEREGVRLAAIAHAGYLVRRARSLRRGVMAAGRSRRPVRRSTSAATSSTDSDDPDPDEDVDARLADLASRLRARGGVG
jgi:hypothetical protein